MARGWESKSVESQIEEAAKKDDDREERWNFEQVDLRQKRDGLLLARARILQDLEAARHDRHRKILQAALEHLDSELAKLS